MGTVLGLGGIRMWFCFVSRLSEVQEGNERWEKRVGRMIPWEAKSILKVPVMSLGCSLGCSWEFVAWEGKGKKLGVEEEGRGGGRVEEGWIGLEKRDRRN